MLAYDVPPETELNIDAAHAYDAVPKEWTWEHEYELPPIFRNAAEPSPAMRQPFSIDEWLCCEV